MFFGLLGLAWFVSALLFFDGGIRIMEFLVCMGGLMKERLKLRKGETLASLLDEKQRNDFVCARIEGKIYELSHVFERDGEAEVEFLSVEDPEGIRIYVTSLRFLVSMAVKLCFPKLDVRIFYNISRSFFIRVVQGKKTYSVNQAFLDEVKRKMEDIIKADVPLSRVKVKKDEALSIYHELGFQDKIQVLRYRKEDFVHLYQAVFDGIVYSDYLYEKMVMSTGCLSRFKLFLYAPGMMLQVPRSEFNGDIPEFKDEINFASALSTNSRWAEENTLDTVVGINRFVKNYGSMALINVCETRFNNQLAKLGEIVLSNPETVRCICIAGPSSSGKTSFSNRLMFELMSHGLRPIRISMDDFYKIPEEMSEKTDIESVEAINVELFNTLISRLVSGESVSLPQYDFKKHERSYRKAIQVGEKEPLIIEGIHALNPGLITQISPIQKFRIYISPQPQMNLDNHTPLSMTYMRLLRRIVRDSRTRNSDARETIDMWDNVRKGEFRYIYPNQENADFVFDSFMHYELCALRNFALPLLEKVRPDDKEYQIAFRLKQMVRYFVPIPISDIPCNSVVREFVGGSSFKDAR